MPNEDPTDEEWQSFLKRPEDVLLKCFPSQIQATQVMSVLDVLSSHSPDEEYIGGKIEPAWEADPTIKAAFEEFRGRLNELEGIIDSRNTDANLKNRSGAGLVPYQLLKPYSDKGKAFDAFCEKFHIPEEVHPVLPNQCDTMHERLAEKIGLYTRAAKVSNFEILCRVYGITPTVGLFRCFYVNSKKNGWMLFKKRSDKSLDGEDMDIFAFIHTPDPTKVKVVEREQIEDEPRLLETTVGRTVPLLPIAPDHAESELEASVDKLFDESGSAKTLEEKENRCCGCGEASHPPKKLKEDHGTPSGAFVGGKSRSAVQRLLVGAVLNAEVKGEPVPTLPFVTYSVSATSGREGGNHTDSVTRPSICTIGASQRFVISSDSSHHSGTNVAEAEVDSLIRSSVPVMMNVTIVTSTVDTVATTKEKPIEASLFGVASSSAGGTDPTPGGFLDRTGSDFLVGGIRTVTDPDTNLQKMVDEFAPPKFFAYVRGMEHDQLFTEFNVGAARQMFLSVEVRMRAEYNIKEKRRLKSIEVEAAEAIRLHAEASKFEAIEKSLQDEMKTLKERNTTLEKEKNDLDVKVIDLAASVVVRECEVADLDTLVHELEEVNDKFDKLYADFIEMTLHLEERFYPHLLTTVFGRRWLLTHGMELAITKCMQYPEYLSALRVAIGKAIEKGMQDGLSARITHGAKGRALTDVAAYNPFAEANYISALQHLQNVNFSLLAELGSNKDTSVDTLTNILRLEETLAERLGLSELQPHVDQLMVHIHRSPDQVVLGASALSLALDVSSSRVQKIKENISNHRSALRDVFVPLAEPLSVTALTGTEGTYNVIPTTADTITALSITFSSASMLASNIESNKEVRSLRILSLGHSIM
ncbi:gypsy type transposase [Tanacetum coccineum]